MKIYPTLLLIILLGSLASLSAQDTVNDNEKIRVAALEMIHNSRYCALITLDESGQPQARTMEAFAPDTNLVVWFGTNKFSRKVGEINNDPRVTIYYGDDTGNGYVVLTGRAEIVDDPGEKKNRWMEHWDQFYPDKKSTYILIKVIPQKLEVVSYKHGLTGDSISWRAPNIEVRQQ